MDGALWREQPALPSACRFLVPLLHVPWPISHGHARALTCKVWLAPRTRSRARPFAASLQIADFVSRRRAIFHALAHPNRPHAPVGGLQDRLVGLAFGTVLRRIGALARLADALGLNAAGGKASAAAATASPKPCCISFPTRVIIVLLRESKPNGSWRSKPFCRTWPWRGTLGPSRRGRT